MRKDQRLKIFKLRVIVIKNLNAGNIFENFLSVAVAISFWLFIAALPPFRIGIWVDSECVLVAAHVAFSIIGFCLSVLWFIKKNLFCSKQTVVFTCFSMVCLLEIFCAKNPVVHHFGVPLLGEGSVLFCGLSLLSFGFDNAKKHCLIYWSATMAGFVAGLLVLLHHPDHGLNINPDWLPYVFGAFLAPMALGIYVISNHSVNKIEQGLLLFLSFALLMLSHNKTAWVALVAVTCFWLITKHTKHGYGLQKILSACIPLLSVIAIYFLGNFSAFSTLESRKLAIQSYVLAWKDAPLTLLFGNGWGYYFENLQKNITELPVQFFHHDMWKPNWDGIDRLDFHCMHFGVEALFCAGVLGVVFYFMLMLTPFTQQNYKKNPFSVFVFVCIFGCLTSTWFTLMCVWPFFVLGFSVLNRHRFVLARAPLTILWLSISTGLCVYGAVTYWQTAMLYPTNPKSAFFNFTNSKKLPTAEAIKKSYNYNGFHLGHFVLNTLKKVNHVPFRVITNELNLALSVYDSKTSPLILDVAILHGLQYFQGPYEQKQKIWGSVANAILKKAPKRSDLLVAYVSELIESRQLDKANDFIKIILKRNSKDVFGLWLKGIYCICENDVGYGKSQMMNALNQGIEKWICIPKSLKHYIEEKPLL